MTELGVEGGGCSIYGREAGGAWTFWHEGSSLDLDEDDEEVVRSWSSEPVPDLGLAMPEEWPLFYVLDVHPDFTAWFREHYEGARGSLGHNLRRMQAGSPHRRWAEVLGL